MFRWCLGGVEGRGGGVLRERGGVGGWGRCKNFIVKSKEYRGSIVILCDGMSALFKTHESSTFVVKLKNTFAFHMHLEPCTICA